MDSGINMFCFSASYAIALVLELLGLWTQIRLRRLLTLVAAAAGLVAHTWYLGRRVAEMPAAPLANQQDWYLLAAWALAVVYLVLKFYYPRSSIGLFVLPVVLGVIGGSLLATTEPLATFQAPRIWVQVHGIFLMLGTVVVLLGFLAGLMYLIQSYRLKQKLPNSDRFRLPSLEWLERVNSWSLGAATLLVGGGFFTGILSRLAQEGDQNFVPWTDPVVISLAAMLLWLVVAEVFRLVYPAARQGRKVAYLTVAAFVFLMLTLAAVTLRDSLHQKAERAVTTTVPNPKSEIRNPKQIQMVAILPLERGQNSKTWAMRLLTACCFEIRVYDLEFVSHFDIRISHFETLSPYASFEISQRGGSS